MFPLYFRDIYITYPKYARDFFFTNGPTDCGCWSNRLDEQHHDSTGTEPYGTSTLVAVPFILGDAICRVYLQSYMHGGPRVQNFRISLPGCPVWEKLAAPPKNTRTISTVRTLGCHHAWPDGRGVGDVGLQDEHSIRRVYGGYI